MIEDHFSALVETRKSGEIDTQAEQKVLASYLNQIRKELEINPEARELAGDAQSPIDIKEELIRILSNPTMQRPYPILREGTEDVLEKAVVMVLNELKELKEQPSSLYLVDNDTGQLLSPISEKDIYQPPDYVGLDGIRRKARPTLNPGLAASIGMARTKAWRQSTLAKQVENDPVRKKSIEHLFNPNKIVDRAKDILKEKGMVIELMNEGEEPDELIDFGREFSGDVHQGMNPSFNRIHAYGNILAKKLEKLLKSGTVAIGELSEKTNGKHKWYRLPVTVNQRFHLEQNQNS